MSVMALPLPTPDILALGEPMVEFNQTGQGAGRLYLQGFGGDTSNFAIAAARQGARVGYLSALGDDPMNVPHMMSSSSLAPPLELATLAPVEPVPPGAFKNTM